MKEGVWNSDRVHQGSQAGAEVMCISYFSLHCGRTPEKKQLTIRDGETPLSALTVERKAF